MSGAPSVSIVLPSFNGARHLEASIESVLAQSHKDWELILVDDGSADDTGERMEAWAARDSRIRVLHLSPNRGLPAALNEGFRHARGELFSWTSDDNAYLPQAIQRLCEALADAPDADIAYADCICFDEEGNERRVYAPSPRLLSLQNVFGGCFLYRREVHEEIGGFDESLFLAEDYDFWLRASTRFRATAVPEALYRYRLHAGSLSSRHGGETHRVAAQAMDRFLPSLPRPERAHALLQRAERLFKRGEPSAARILALRGVLASPLTALRRRHRRTLALCLLGHRNTSRLGSAFAPSPRRTVRLLVPDRVGGMASHALDLAAARPEAGPPLELYWLTDPDDRHARVPEDLSLPVDRVARIPHRWPRENLFSVLRRVRRAWSDDPGVLVTSELLGLACAARHGPLDSVVHVVHGDSPVFYEVAEAFEPFIDGFVTSSARIREELVRRMPQRAADIRTLRSGVRTSGPRRGATSGPLRLIFSGRLEEAKGVLDLPRIDRLLRARGDDVVWTVVGDGPLTDAVRTNFAQEAEVRFTGALAPDEAREIFASHDVLVLPTRAEGPSLALLEAMAAGVVPVTSELPSGTREIVESGSTGFLAQPGRPEDLAAAISRLARDRALLERVSAAAAARAEARHSLGSFGADLFEWIDALSRRPTPHRPSYRRGPGRLDRPWIPNAVVRGLEAVRPGKR